VKHATLNGKVKVAKLEHRSMVPYAAENQELGRWPWTQNNTRQRTKQLVDGVGQFIEADSLFTRVQLATPRAFP
jgi:hypothetical protein